MWLMFLWACGEEKIEDTVIVSRPNEDTVYEDTGMPVLRDIDQDGFLEDVDCDDWNPNIYPEAEEIWNDEDDDCDGYVDIDGVYTGQLQAHSVGIYNGQSYVFSDICRGEVVLVRGQVTMTIQCDIDQNQEKAALLLGQTLSVSSAENFIFDLVGDSSATFVSVGGEMEWDAMGNVQWSWSDISQIPNRVHTRVVLDAFYLDMDVQGDLYKE